MNIAPLRPLLCPETVYDLSRIGSSEELLDLIESGEISVAFDLRAPSAAKRTIRIYWPALRDWMSKERCCAEYKLDDVIHEIIGAERKSLALVFFARAIKCSALHVRNLIDARKLKLLSKPRTGPNGSPQICYKSAFSFLKSARIL
jgi:hypothetical protein